MAHFQLAVECVTSLLITLSIRINIRMGIRDESHWNQFRMVYICTEWMYFDFFLLIKGFIAGAQTSPGSTHCMLILPTRKTASGLAVSDMANAARPSMLPSGRSGGAATSSNELPFLLRTPPGLTKSGIEPETIDYVYM